MPESESVRVHIAPWALPGEEIPIQVEWQSGFDFDTVIVSIPEGFSFVEFTNLDEVKTEGCRATIERSNISKAEASTYFGCVIRYTRIPQEISNQGRVAVTFVKQGEVKLSSELEARIFRPKLDIVEAPKEIELRQTGMVKSLPISLRYTGFGDIQLRIEASIGGTIVSESGSVASEILRRLWLYGILEKEADIDKTKKKEKLRVAPDYVRTITNEIQQILDSGEIPPDVFGEKESKELREQLRDLDTKNRFMDLMYSRTEDMILGLLVDLLESHPATNVRLMDPRAKILTQIRAPIEKLLLRLRYRDLLGNEYEPVEVPIKVVDQCNGEKPVLDIPIMVEKWEDDPLLNVAGV